MELRVGVFVFSVNALFLAAAYAFFLVVAYGALYPAVSRRKPAVAAVLTIVSATGATGAWLYGLVGHAGPSPTPLPRHAEFAFGSFGGYWGVLAGSLLSAALLRTPPLCLADALVPAIIVGGAVARLAGLFGDSNPGLPITCPGLPWLRPFQCWAPWDIAAHLVVLCLAGWGTQRARHRPGAALVVFLLAYGVLRFGLESLRDTYHVVGMLTIGHIMAAIQITAGAGLAFAVLRVGRDPTGSPYSPLSD